MEGDVKGGRVKISQEGKNEHLKLKERKSIVFQEARMDTLKRRQTYLIHGSEMQIQLDKRIKAVKHRTIKRIEKIQLLKRDINVLNEWNNH